MNKQKISENNNIIIAKFFFNISNNEIFFYDKITSKSSHDIKDLKFNKSWDWLMEIVIKINYMTIDNNAIRVTMRDNATLIEKVGIKDWEAGIIYTGEGMFENTYKSIIEFIKWCNFNNIKYENK